MVSPLDTRDDDERFAKPAAGLSSAANFECRQ
jgi:hypothetical protein